MANRITVEQCFDADLLTTVLSHRDVYPHISDDHSPKREEFKAIVGQPIIWLLIKCDEKPAGAFLLHPHNMSLWEVHTNVLPGYRDHSLEACKACWEWLTTNTPCNTLMTYVPKPNKPARRLAKAFGMKDFGYLPNSWLKDGEYEDLYIMGVTK